VVGEVVIPGRAALALTVAATAVALTACAELPPQPLPDPAPPQGCEAARVQDIVGLQGSQELEQAARTRAGAEIARTIAHDQMVTREFREGRLNLWLDAQGRVRQVSCG
jgi:hypothetical protein